ncbi:ABC transporter substrate-binding protein [Alphaproteobacteria bacterium]|nr:ABC transporter substrate-binding protein [Alphaproteobacteria bacterium]
MYKKKIIKSDFKKLLSNIAKIFIVISLFSFIFSNLKADSLKIYSERQPFLIEPLIKAYEKSNNTKVEWIFSKKGLVQKVIIEKNQPIADIFLSSDIARLMQISNAGASIKIPKVISIPDYLQSKHWVALTQRARIIYVAKNKNITSINYEDLVSDNFKGKVCMRSGFHPYNISLFSSLMENNNELWLRDYLIKLKSNLARKPQGNDRDQVKAIAAGVCDVAYANHYYYFKMLDNKDQKKWLEKVDPIFPNQNKGGTHINISGITLINEMTKDKALHFLNFLISEDAQSIYASDNYEFPANPNVKPAEKVSELRGEAKFEETSLIDIAANRKAVVAILNEINFDE